MDLQTLSAELTEVKDIQIRRLSKETLIQMIPDEKIINVFEDGQTWQAALAHYDQTMRHLGFSNAMAKRLAATTASQVASELLRQKGEVTALTRYDELLGMAPKGRYKELPVDLVLEVIQQNLGDAGTVDCNRAMILPKYGVRLEMIGDTEHEVVKGDLIRAGVMVEFNPVGLTNPVVQSFGVRLVCTNGMTSNQVLESYSMTADVENTREWLRQSVTKAYTGLADAVQRWRMMAGTAVTPTDRTLILGGIARDAKLNAKEQTALFTKAAEEPPETAYDVLNLATWVTSHVMTQPQRVIRAQNAVARFVQEDTAHKYCPTCKRVGG